MVQQHCHWFTYKSFSLNLIIQRRYYVCELISLLNVIYLTQFSLYLSMTILLLSSIWLYRIFFFFNSIHYIIGWYHSSLFSKDCDVLPQSIHYKMRLFYPCLFTVECDGITLVYFLKSVMVLPQSIPYGMRWYYPSLFSKECDGTTPVYSLWNEMILP